VLRNELYKPWFSKDKDWGFEVIDGEYSGVVVQVTDLQFKEETSEDNSNLSVEYHVISKPEIISEESVKSDLFNALFQTIITDLVSEAIENYANNRDDDSKESDSQ
jgi:hypothetical protein